MTRIQIRLLLKSHDISVLFWRYFILLRHTVLCESRSTHIIFFFKVCSFGQMYNNNNNDDNINNEMNSIIKKKKMKKKNKNKKKLY